MEGRCNVVRAVLLAFSAVALCLVFPACSQAPVNATTKELYVRDPAKPLYDIEPVRGEQGPLLLHADGQTAKCSLCHDGFEGNMTEEALQDQHKDIKFDHGLNLRCLNCHNPKNADTFVNHDGSAIPGDKPTLLCAKCHGPHYREWQLGVHGRVNGYWDAKYGKQKKLDCIQCHNPHHPRFQPIVPEPTPRLTRFEKGKLIYGK